MSSVKLADRPVQLRHDDEQDEDFESSEQELIEGSQSDDGESQPDDEDTAPSPDPEEDNLDDGEPSLADISFGALAKAQETFIPKPRKRKFAETQNEHVPSRNRPDEEKTFDTRKRAKEVTKQVPKRTSKHAPPVESARKPVSRKRVIFEPPPSAKFRDPRFDPTVMSANRYPSATDVANKNYSFLSQYQAEEILQLKAEIKKTKDPDVVAGLKRKVMSMESKIRNAESRQREAEIRKRHKATEKEALRSGQKARPYYLKEADVKKLAKEERLQSLGKRARDKAENRRRKREKTKASRDMPRVRRER